MWFSKNKVDTRNSFEEQSKIWEHIKSMEVTIVKLEASVEKIEQLFRSLRGFINKKYKLEPADEETLKEDPVDDGFDFLRTH